MESIGTDAAAIEVLLVEDSPGDVRLTREAFKDAKVHINLSVASDGAEAMAFLKHEGNPRQGSPAGFDLTRFEPAQERRPGGLGGTQRESGTEVHSGGYLDDLCIRNGYPGELSAPCELLHRQTRGPRGVPQSGEEHRQFLAVSG